MNEKTVYLVLENGKVFRGHPFGAEGEAVGEIVFTTAMTGYLETLTDPGYYGLLVVQTFPLIGNYGVISADTESEKPALGAYIVRDWCQDPSNFRCEGDLDTFLKEKGVIGLYGIDTRELTRIVREAGVMNAKITTDIRDLPAIQQELAAHTATGAVAAVSCREEKTFAPDGETKANVVLWDFGCKRSLVNALTARGCEVTVVPFDTTAERIRELAPDGLLLSSGPGDPSENTAVIDELRALLPDHIPTFGIDLGHLLLALAHGARADKMKYGHRGGNQPAKDCATGRVYITSQGHGYTVAPDSLPENARVSFVNANDGTCEGIAYDDENAFSVQFHPEACAGPLDTTFLFDRFIDSMTGGDTVCR